MRLVSRALRSTLRGAGRLYESAGLEWGSSIRTLLFPGRRRAISWIHWRINNRIRRRVYYWLTIWRRIDDGIWSYRIRRRVGRWSVNHGMSAIVADKVHGIKRSLAHELRGYVRVQFHGIPFLDDRGGNVERSAGDEVFLYFCHKSGDVNL